MLASTLVLLSVAAVTNLPSTLSGRVTDEQGNPLAGASVSIYTAKPRVGVGTLCPSCYRDCAKSTTSDAEGRYSIAGLDASLLFRVLVAAPGRSSVVTEHIDPHDGDIDTALSKPPVGLPENRQLTGRIVDADGKPIGGAIVQPYGAKTKSRRWRGAMPGVDAAVVTDAEGTFVVTSEDPKLGMDFRVYARGFATKTTPLLELNGKPQTVQLEVGAHVVGKLMHDGKPVAGCPVGIVQVSRSSDSFVGETTLATDTNGMFTFFNLQPDDEYAVYTLCERTSGAAQNETRDSLTMKAKRLKTGSNGETLEAGKLELVEGLTLSGKVILPDGKPIPQNSTIRLSRSLAWDWVNMSIDENGSFHVRGVPPEVFTVHIHVAGYEIDSNELPFQMVRDNAFGLSMKKSRDNVMISLRQSKH